MIILLNDAMSSGNTTIPEQLVQLLPATAHVEMFALSGFIQWMPLLEAIPLNRQNAVAITRNFVGHGLNVVLSYTLILDHYEFFMRELTPLGVPIYCFTLNLDYDLPMMSPEAYDLMEWEVKRVLYNHERSNSFPFGVVIDNARQTPEETAQEILDRVKEQASAAE